VASWKQAKLLSAAKAEKEGVVEGVAVVAAAVVTVGLLVQRLVVVAMHEGSRRQSHQHEQS
jgi:hypothetical protein